MSTDGRTTPREYATRELLKWSRSFLATKTDIGRDIALTMMQPHIEFLNNLYAKERQQ